MRWLLGVCRIYKFSTAAFTPAKITLNKGCYVLTTHPVLTEWAEDPVTELSFGHRASDFRFLIITTLHFRKGRARAFPCLPHVHFSTSLLMNRASTWLFKGLGHLVAAAGVQAAGGGGGGQSVPVVGELVPQRGRQGVHGANSELLLHIRVQRGAGVSKSKAIHHIWRVEGGGWRRVTM